MTTPFLGNCFNISPEIRSNPGDFLELRLVLISSATSLGVTGEIFSVFGLSMFFMSQYICSWLGVNIFAKCSANKSAFCLLSLAHGPLLLLIGGIEVIGLLVLLVAFQSE